MVGQVGNGDGVEFTLKSGQTQTNKDPQVRNGGGGTPVVKTNKSGLKKGVWLARKPQLPDVVQINQ